MKPQSRALLRWYASCGRAALPWRRTRDPYRVLVSEFMLQQTQVERVLPAFRAFTARFPTFEALASASPADVLRAWKGLGYNTRAIRLHRVTKEVLRRFGGTLPSDATTLRGLPGLGAYTVSALRAFAFDCDDAAMDTNLQRVVHRLHFGIEFPRKASRAQLDALAREMIPRGRGSDWNSAMMDLGATICTARAPKCLLCPLQRHCEAAPLDAAALDRARMRHSKRPSPQEALPFERTTRYARGRIVDRLRALSPGERISLLDLHRELEPVLAGRSAAEVGKLVDGLVRDGLVEQRNERLALPYEGDNE